jgi:hypothetical protein
MKKKSPHPLKDWNSHLENPHSNEALGRLIGCSGMTIARWAEEGFPRESFLPALSELMGREMERSDWMV